MTDLFRIDDHAALITGGGRGLGRAMAVALAHAGADSVLVARREKDLAETVRLVEAAGRRAVAVPGDVCAAETAPRAVEACLAAFGRIDILVNNAGLYAMSPLDETPADAWHEVLDVNVMGSYRFAHAVGPHFREQGSGKVVNVSSILGKIGVADATAYCTAKAAILGFTRALAVEWAPHGIHVNALAPGLFETDMSAGVLGNPEIYEGLLAGIPRGRHAQPADLAGTIVYLCSPASDHVVGQVVHIDGGATIA